MLTLLARVTVCSIQGLVAAHWPPVALPTWPYTGIPARLFGLRTILGTEGFCNRSVYCVLSVRSRRQGGGKICSGFSVTGQGAGRYVADCSVTGQGAVRYIVDLV